MYRIYTEVKGTHFQTVVLSTLVLHNKALKGQLCIYWRSSTQVLHTAASDPDVRPGLFLPGLCSTHGRSWSRVKRVKLSPTWVRVSVCPSTGLPWWHCRCTLLCQNHPRAAPTFVTCGPAAPPPSGRFVRTSELDRRSPAWCSGTAAACWRRGWSP